MYFRSLTVRNRSTLLKYKITIRRTGNLFALGVGEHINNVMFLNLSLQSGSEKTEDEEKDYKALYEASQGEVRRLRALLTTSEQQLREARATIGRLTQVV